VSRCGELALTGTEHRGTAGIARRHECRGEETSAALCHSQSSTRTWHLSSLLLKPESVNMRANVCHRTQTFLCRTLIKPQNCTEAGEDEPCGCVSSGSGARGDRSVGNISVRNPQVRASSRAGAARSCWLGCCRAVVPLAAGWGCRWVVGGWESCWLGRGGC